MTVMCYITQTLIRVAVSLLFCGGCLAIIYTVAYTHDALKRRGRERRSAKMRAELEALKRPPP